MTFPRADRNPFLSEIHFRLWRQERVPDAAMQPTAAQNQYNRSRLARKEYKALSNGIELSIR